MNFHQHIGFVDNADGASVFIDDRKLRNIRAAHPLERGEQRIVRADRDHFACFVSMRNQIAQIAVRRPVNESLFGHPEVVVHFGEILIAGVGNESDHTFRLCLLPAISQRTGDQRAGR